MTSGDITRFGREIVSSISQSDIPYTDYWKCKVFQISWTTPAWAFDKGKDPHHEILKNSHIDISWSARPHRRSSIIWTNLKRIKTGELVAIINAVKRDKKLEKILS